jgi:glycosyltransferase involved in cell wall biosynthesis
MGISGLVITYNEEKNIERCVKTLFKVCDEVIIIDSFSTDKTAVIAEMHGAKVYYQKFLGDGLQRRHGLQFCKNDWILNPDTDEYLDEDALAFIMSKSYETEVYDGYEFRRNNYLAEEKIDFAGWYPDYACRFFNKKTASPSEAKIHQKIIGNKIKRINVHLTHYAWSSFFQIIAKKNQYTDWQVQDLIKAQRRTTAFSPFIHGFSSFFTCYFLKRGVFNGLDGFTFSLIQAFFSYMKYAKLRKAQKVIK